MVSAAWQFRWNLPERPWNFTKETGQYPCYSVMPVGYLAAVNVLLKAVCCDLHNRILGIFKWTNILLFSSQPETHLTRKTNNCPSLSSFLEKALHVYQIYCDSTVQACWLLIRLSCFLQITEYLNINNIEEIKFKKSLQQRDLEIVTWVPWHTWIKWNWVNGHVCPTAALVVQDFLGSGWGGEEVVGSALMGKHLSLGKGQASIRHCLTSFLVSLGS